MRIFLQFLILFPSSFLCAQQTVGLFQNTPKSFNGYTLFGNNEITYLIDNCGFKVHTWESEFDPGLTMYLLENGNLLRTERFGGSFSVGGLGGRFEILNWDGNQIWGWKLANNTVHAHHDIEPLPNGNFLALAFEKISQSAAKQNGRAYDGDVWSEKIVEIQPVGSNQANIVWEWRLWDHLIQDFDPSKLNYGDVAEHPELIDLNYIGDGEDTDGDWIHANAIAYNSSLDQIAVSSRNFSEIWIIDHSTTTAQAASHSGGNSDKGGDILYRYGNPKAYKRGTDSDQKFFRQHDIRWIPEGMPHSGKLMVFNNDYLPNQSSVEIWTPPFENGNYLIENDLPFGPNTPDWVYTHEEFYSDIMSGAEMLSNGNILICEGETGRFFEITLEKEIVWEYINPVNRNGGPTAQGGSVHFNEMFRVKRYSTDYEGLTSKDLPPTVPVEINPWDSDCEIYDEPMGVFSEFLNEKITVLGNPFSNIFNIKSEIQNQVLRAEFFDTFGNSILTFPLNFGMNSVETSDLNSGIFLINIRDKSGNFTFKKVVKN